MPVPRRTRTTHRTAAAAAPAPRAASAEERARDLRDPAGDTVVDQTDAALSEGRADIVQAGSAYGPGSITFQTQVDRPTDPRDDERWAGNGTFALWSVDTNGDTIADYEIRYFLADEDNVGGYVSRPGEDTAQCSVSTATYSAEGYKVTVDPACLANPPSLSFRASMYYDTSPDGTASIATDTAPDKGWSPTVTRPSSSQVGPQTRHEQVVPRNGPIAALQVRPNQPDSPWPIVRSCHPVIGSDTARC